jgi:hypothetical protein
MTRPKPKPRAKTSARLRARKETRKVHVTERVKARAGQTLWAWSIADFAVLLGMKERGVWELIEAGVLDPYDLASICKTWLARVQSPRYKRQWPTEHHLPRGVLEELRGIERRKAEIKAGGKTYEINIARAEALIAGLPDPTCLDE